MINGQLCGKRSFSSYEPIAPESISAVREYGFNNPFLLVVSDGKKYQVRPSSKDYDEIFEWLESHTPFKLKGKFVHKLNYVLFRWRPFSFRNWRKKR